MKRRVWCKKMGRSKGWWRREQRKPLIHELQRREKCRYPFCVVMMLLWRDVHKMKIYGVPFFKCNTTTSKIYKFVWADFARVKVKYIDMKENSKRVKEGDGGREYMFLNLIKVGYTLICSSRAEKILV